MTRVTKLDSGRSEVTATSFWPLGVTSNRGIAIIAILGGFISKSERAILLVLEKISARQVSNVVAPGWKCLWLFLCRGSARRTGLIRSRGRMAAPSGKEELCRFNIWGFDPRRAAGITPTW